ncbi:MAG: hypothetical protein ABI833_09660, partial [Acidobacteriota bacterium]
MSPFRADCAWITGKSGNNPDGRITRKAEPQHQLRIICRQAECFRAPQFRSWTLLGHGLFTRGIPYMTKVGRAAEKGETQGFMKILVDANTHEI